MYRLTNISNAVIGIDLPNQYGRLSQYNLFPSEYIEVEELSSQMRRICDPYRKQIKLQIVEV